MAYLKHCLVFFLLFNSARAVAAVDFSLNISGSSIGATVVESIQIGTMPTYQIHILVNPSGIGCSGCLYTQSAPIWIHLEAKRANLDQIQLIEDCAKFAKLANLLNKNIYLRFYSDTQNNAYSPQLNRPGLWFTHDYTGRTAANNNSVNSYNLSNSNFKCSMEDVTVNYGN